MIDQNDSGERAGIPQSENIKAFEKLLDRVLVKYDSTKNDLDSLWTKQIVAVGASVALVVGLNKVVSQKVFGDASYGCVLFVILPIVNLYFMMRFGFLTYAFSEARSAAEALSERFIDERGLSRYFSSNGYSAQNNLPVDRHVIYSTNSYFEPIYQRTSSFSLWCYSLFIPIVFALSHSTSIYLLINVINTKNITFVSGALTLIVITVYTAILIALYTTLYNGLYKLRLFVPKIILFIDIISLILTITFLAVLFLTRHNFDLSCG